MITRLLFPVALLLLQTGCGGLGIPQSFDAAFMRFGEGTENFASATGRLVRGSDLESMTLESLRLGVTNAPEFTVRFPDGSRLSSKNLTAGAVMKHGASLGEVHDYTEKGIRYLRWGLPREVVVLFLFKEDRGAGLYLRGPFHCPNVSLDNFAIEWSNGDTLKFPLPYGKLRQALGKPTSIQSEAAISVWACPR